MKNLAVLFIAFCLAVVFTSCEKEEAWSAAHNPVDAKASLNGQVLNVAYIVGVSENSKSFEGEYPDGLYAQMDFINNVLTISHKNHDTTIVTDVIFFKTSFSGTTVTISSDFDNEIVGVYEVVETEANQGRKEFLLKKKTGPVVQICLIKK